MEMRVAQAWHQCRAHSIDNGLRPTSDRATHARGSLGYLPNAITLDADLPGVRVFTGAIQDADVGEEHAARAIAVGSIVAVRHRYSSLWRRRPNFLEIGGCGPGLIPSSAACPHVFAEQARAVLRPLDRRP